MPDTRLYPHYPAYWVVYTDADGAEVSCQCGTYKLACLKHDFLAAAGIASHLVGLGQPRRWAARPDLATTVGRSR